MSKRKKRRGNRPQPKKLDDTSLGTLADAFSERLAPPPSSAEPKGSAVQEVRQMGRRSERARSVVAANRSEAPERVSPEELMRRAFEAAEGSSLYDGKYHGAGFDAGDVEVEEPERQSKEPVVVPAELDEPTGDDLLFFETIGAGTKRIESKRVTALDATEWVGASWHDEVELRSLTPEELHEPTLGGGQRQLLRKSRRASMRVLNIRHLRKHEAMREVEAFVRAERVQRSEFVRIITGKGKQSVGNPVLKPAVIDWCENEAIGLVKGWAPETDRSGNYGSVVLHLDLRGAL